MDNSNSKVKHIRFNEFQLSILDELIANDPNLKNYAEAVRYLVLDYDNRKSEHTNENKLNVLNKNVDILIEMVAGGFTEQGIQTINPSHKSYIYTDAKKFVEKNIQRQVTKNLDDSTRQVNSKDVRRSQKDEIQKVVNPTVIRFS